MAFKNQNQMFLYTALFLLLLASHASSRSINHELSLLERHEQWMAQHGRVYNDAAEKAFRFKIFKDNIKRIETFNHKKDNKYTLGINKFSDLTIEEFRSIYTNYHNPANLSSTFRTTMTQNGDNNTTLLSDDAPASWDWRDHGAVTNVKDQQQCGCCWAFSTVGAIEGMHQIATGQLLSLSEQELVDCVTGNHGCHGGSMTTAFDFVRQNGGGITSESSYPYTSGNGQYGNACQADAVTGAVTISGYTEVNDEGALLEAVLKQPVSLGIDGSDYYFLHYSSGVFTGPCNTQITHAVTLVGYGTSDDGTGYWLIKNSWGTGWGENGYMRIARNYVQGGLCGIGTMSSYPLA